MPPAILINGTDLAKSYGPHRLFRGLTLAVYEGDRLGVVGPNGVGKSTLLKVLAGLEPPDSGTCSRRKNLRVGYVPQHATYPEGSSPASVLAAALEADGRLLAGEREVQAAKTLSRCGFGDPAVPVDRLSGGWRARLSIARALALDPEILLLDEPTNHLDIESILWLEGLMQAETRAFIVVSHDRYFLQNVAGRMLDIDRVYAAGSLVVDGGYVDLLEARAGQLANQQRNQETLANRVRNEIAWLRRGPKARTSKAKARIDAAEQSIEQLAESRRRSAVGAAGIELQATGRKTKRLWSCRGLAKGFGTRRIVEDLELLLTPGMRLAVLGPNGSGKTTLLRMIDGELAPDAGEIERAEDLRVAHFDQNRRSVDPSVSLKEALSPEGESVVYQDRSLHVASWAQRFLFRTEQLEQPVSSLSGGERARIALARVMLQPADLLILDEPTNDLDIATLEVLEESLLEFAGAVVLVTHDRHLIERTATGVLGLDGQGAARRLADYGQWEAERREAARPAKPARSKKGKPDAAARPKRRSYLEQREWDGMEERVLAAEARLEEARGAAEDPAIATDAAALQQRLTEVAEAETEVDRLYARWAELEIP